MEFQQSYPGHYRGTRGHFNALATSPSQSNARTLWYREQGGTLHLLHLVTEKIQQSSCWKLNPLSLHLTELPRSVAYDVEKVPPFVAYGIDKQQT